MKRLIFSSEQHRAFYEKNMARVRDDSYHKALFYLLGVSADTRQRVNRLFDFEEDCIRPEALNEGWQTSGSMRVVRLAFNLYCNGTPSVYDSEDQNEQLEECSRYTVENLFCCSYAPYFWQAVKIRYPEYTED